MVYLKQLVTNFATQCFTPEGDHQANEYSYTISLDGLCDEARHIACANNLNLSYVFARACARLNFKHRTHRTSSAHAQNFKRAHARANT